MNIVLGLYFLYIIVAFPYIYYTYIVKTIGKYRSFGDFVVEYTFKGIAGPFYFFIFLFTKINWSFVVDSVLLKVSLINHIIVKNIELRAFERERREFIFTVVKTRHYSLFYKDNTMFLLDYQNYTTSGYRILFSLDSHGKVNEMVLNVNEFNNKKEWSTWV